MDNPHSFIPDARHESSRDTKVYATKNEVSSWIKHHGPVIDAMAPPTREMAGAVKPLAKERRLVSFTGKLTYTESTGKCVTVEITTCSDMFVDVAPHI